MHLEALTSNAKNLWLKLGNFPDFVLAGGTALALQIGHRKSVDFNFFSDKKIKRALLKKVERVFKNEKIEILVNNPEEPSLIIGSTQITFLEYPFHNITKPKIFEGVKIMSILDIAASKAYTMGRRATYKDYIDVYFILFKKYCSLGQIMKTAEKKYGGASFIFNSRLFLEQLLYLKDVEPAPITFLGKSVSPDTVENFFRQEIKKLKF